MSNEEIKNANMNDAAPALLEALEEVMEWIDNWGPNFVQDEEWGETRAQVLAAIAQAKGGNDER